MPVFWIGWGTLRKTDLFSSRAVGGPATGVGRSGYLVRVDALSLLRGLRSGIADVVFLDPPFNLGKEYGIATRFEGAADKAYEESVVEVLTESERVLADGGALYLYHLPRWAVLFANHLMGRLTFQHWIAVAMKNGFARRDGLYPAHYALLFFTKGPPAAFERPRIRPSRCRHCGGYVKDYGGYTSIIEERGINLSDVWEDISPVRHPMHKLRAANQLPELLTDRVMHMSGREGGLLVDPFVGTGTSLVSARRHGMEFIGGDVSEEAIAVARLRLTSGAGRRI